ncbi:MAG: MarR family transcriptional regulator [Kineosporiaceae bacterium]
MSETRWLDDAEQAVWRSYLDVMRLLNERLQRQLTEESDLSLAEYDILVHLSETTSRAMRMSELADKVVNSRSRLTHTVARLERRGMVVREACPDDGRGVNCRLTEAGFDILVRAAPGHVEQVRTSVFDPLTADDVAALGAAMVKIRAGLRGEAEAAGAQDTAGPVNAADAAVPLGARPRIAQA